MSLRHLALSGAVHEHISDSLSDMSVTVMIYTLTPHLKGGGSRKRLQSILRSTPGSRPREALGLEVRLVRTVGHCVALEGEECSGATISSHYRISILGLWLCFPPAHTRISILGPPSTELYAPNI
jgi:hypothetical protein